MEGVRDGEMDGGRGVDGWREGGREGGRDGGMEGGREGRMKGGKGVCTCTYTMYPLQQTLLASKGAH